MSAKQLHHKVDHFDAPSIEACGVGYIEERVGGFEKEIKEINKQIEILTRGKIC